MRWEPAVPVNSEADGTPYPHHGRMNFVAHGDQWVLQKGLEKGERVVTEGTQKIRGGIVVKPSEAGTAKS